ncbi:MAG: phosphatase PAP2 family protein [bacterium]
MNWNQTLFFKIHDLAGKNKFLDAFSVFGGRWLIYLVILLYFLYWLLVQNVFSFLLFILMAIFTAGWLVGLLLNYLLHLIVRKPRPYSAYPDKVKPLFIPFIGKQKSFPSDHAMTVFLPAMIFLFLSPQLCLFFTLLALWVCWGRIYAGVHYPADILGGIFVSCISSSLIVYFYYLLIFKFL